jgi:hypothetical protein
MMNSQKFGNLLGSAVLRKRMSQLCNRLHFVCYRVRFKAFEDLCMENNFCVLTET